MWWYVTTTTKLIIVGLHMIIAGLACQWESLADFRLIRAGFVDQISWVVNM